MGEQIGFWNMIKNRKTRVNFGLCQSDQLGGSQGPVLPYHRTLDLFLSKLIFVADFLSILSASYFRVTICAKLSTLPEESVGNYLPDTCHVITTIMEIYLD